MNVSGAEGGRKPDLRHHPFQIHAFLIFACIGVTCGTLTLGLWPFHARRNGATWTSQRGLHFAKDSTVLSSGPLHVPSSTDHAGVSLEIWLQPNYIWDSGTFLAFYRAGGICGLSLRDHQTDLILKTAPVNGNRRDRSFRVKDIFRRPLPGQSKSPFSLVTIAAGEKGTSVYRDGDLAAAEFPLSREDLNASFVIGDSPGQPDSWKGQLLGLAVYDRQLDASSVREHYSAWTGNRGAELAREENTVALYLFDEHQGSIIHNKAKSGVDLVIPERYQVIDKIALEPFWREFSMTGSYWSAVLKNIVGFIPFGIAFGAYFSVARPITRSVLVTIVLGFATSLTIEVFQIFLPNRDSGTTDLITNTFGTWIGVASYRALMPYLAKFFPPLSIFAPRI